MVKQVVHARLKEGEVKRVKILEKMAAAEQRKEKLKPQRMTQADRLAEAEKTERHNRKDLNKWEEMERRRAEEQKAKLEAMRNKRLEGPVLTWWSGRATWVDGKMARAGAKGKVDDAEGEGKSKNKKKRTESQVQDLGRRDKPAGEDAGLPAPGHVTVADQSHQDEVAGRPGDEAVKSDRAQVTFAPPQDPQSFLTGIRRYATMQEEHITQASSAADQPANTTDQSEPAPPDCDIGPLRQDLPTAADEAPLGQTALPTLQSAPQIHTDPGQRPDTPRAPIREQATRNLVILENFDPRAIQDRGDFSVLFNSKKIPKSQSKAAPSDRKHFY